MQRTQDKKKKQHYGVGIGVCDNIHVLNAAPEHDQHNQEHQYDRKAK